MTGQTRWRTGDGYDGLPMGLAAAHKENKLRLFSMLEGIGIGALAMYFLDPDRGNGRRATVRDRAQGMVREKQHALDIMTRDFNNRREGLVKEIQARREHDYATDETIIERVRAKLGHCCSHSNMISVSCENGHVTLTGEVPANEVQAVVRVANMTRGVERVDNQLLITDSQSQTRGDGGGSNGHHWSPSTSLGVVVGGSLLTLWGLTRRGPVGFLVGVGGVAAILRAFDEVENRHAPGRKSGRFGSSIGISHTVGHAVDTLSSGISRMSEGMERARGMIGGMADRDESASGGQTPMMVGSTESFVGESPTAGDPTMRRSEALEESGELSELPKVVQDQIDDDRI